MAQEIERKFLVKGDYKSEAYKCMHIVQGYLNSTPERVVRVRLRDEQGFITVKGITNDTGVSRFEWEMEIPAEDARDLLKICEPGVIDKMRYLVKAGQYTFEVDEFYGDNEGLVVAEIELPSEDAPFIHPTWLGQEVTGNPRYYNASLVKNPIKK